MRRDAGRVRTIDIEHDIATDNEPAAHGLGRSEFIAMASLITATIAISIDTVLPAFGEIEESYGLTDDGLPVSLTITLFFAALGLGNLFWGPIADRYGRKPVMYVSLAAVVAGAILSSFAPTFEIFLAGRVLWGLASAGPRTVIVAMTRDSYEGDAMARIMSLTLAVFLIVPILAPALGEALLALGSWRLTTLAAAVLATIGALWFGRAAETLDPNNMLPLEFGRVGRAAKTVLTNKPTVLFTIAATMTYGSFFPWLGSSPTLIGDIYGRDGQFALIFGANAILMALAIVIVEKLVSRFSTFPIVLAQTFLLLAVAGAYILISLSADGVPPFWIWFVLVSVLTALNSSSSPLFQSLAMQPMGAVAGTAASVIGAFVFLVGAVLGSLIDRAIDDTVTPFGVGFFIYGLVILIAVLQAKPGMSQSA